MPAQQSYTVPMENQTIVADATLIIVHSVATAKAAGSVLEVQSVHVSQQGTNVSQRLGIIIATKVTAFGTYTSTTPVNNRLGGPASTITGGTAGAAGTAGTDASAEGAGTVTDIFSEGFDNIAGWLWVPTDDEKPLIQNDIAFIVKLRGTPNVLTGWNAHLVYKEMN